MEFQEFDSLVPLTLSLLKINCKSLLQGCCKSDWCCQVDNCHFNNTNRGPAHTMVKYLNVTTYKL